MSELSGGQVDYYVVPVPHPRRQNQVAYNAECEDIISSLQMTFDEGCEFKAIWRTAAARLDNAKKNHSAIYDAEKRVHYASMSLLTEKFKQQFKTMSAPINIFVDDDDWVKWNGGVCPVMGHVKVFIKIRSGNTVHEVEPIAARNLQWGHTTGIPRNSDIIAYKLA